MPTSDLAARGVTAVAVHALGRHPLVGLVVAAALCGCGAGAMDKAPANPVREALERSLLSRAAAEPLRLRYNPAACDCPPFELRVGDRWVRAIWTNRDAEQAAATSRMLRAAGPSQWPVHLLVRARIDPEIMRTLRGDYALRFETTAILSGPGWPAARPGPPPAGLPSPTSASDR